MIEPHDIQHTASDATRLVLLAQRGDREAFGLLYGMYAPMVHGVLLANASANDADDLLQDVFARALDKLDMLRDPAAFGSWLCTIARNTVRMTRRNKLKLVPLHDDTAEAPPAPTLDGERVLAVIRSLPDAYRETLVLRLVEGMGGKEIATRTGLTEGSVRVNLSRGMSMLREKLGDMR